MPDSGHEAETIVRFADGSRIQATYHRHPEGKTELMTDGYTTQKGHPVNGAQLRFLHGDFP
jgi:hypothetical protein